MTTTLNAIALVGFALMLISLACSALLLALLMTGYVVRRIREAIPPDFVPERGDGLPSDARCLVVGGRNTGSFVVVCWLAHPWADSYFVEREDGRYDYESGCDLEVVGARKVPA